MGWREWLWKQKTAPRELRAVSPTVMAYVYAPGGSPSGFYRRSGITYEQAAAEGYSKNVIAYCAVDEVAKAVSAVPWLCYRAGGTDRTEVPMPPVIERPNPYQSWADFLYALVSYERISGNAFIEAIAPTILAPPEALYLHRPDKIRP